MRRFSDAPLALLIGTPAKRVKEIGAPSLNRPLSADERKLLAHLLAESADMPQTEIAKTLGVSRQMIHRYLRGTDDG